MDSLINAIYVFDDHIKIVYNGNGKEEIVSLEELESSTLFLDGAPKHFKSEPSAHRSSWFGFAFYL